MNVLIYGSGIMGRGISEVLITNDIKVLLYNPKINSSQKAYTVLLDRFEKLLSQNRITINIYENFINNIEIIREINKDIDIDLVIEAIPEDIELKKNAFKVIDNKVNSNAIIATNTSSLSISELAKETERPNKVIGIHFFNPAPVIELIEIISSDKTSSETKEFVNSFVKSLNKTPVFLNESPGFIVNRILMPMINEAITLLSEGITSAENIDLAMQKGSKHPMGPLALADLIGLDVCLNIMETLQKNLTSNDFVISPLLKKLVEQKKLGRKTSHGFYKY